MPEQQNLTSNNTMPAGFWTAIVNGILANEAQVNAANQDAIMAHYGRPQSGVTSALIIGGAVIIAILLLKK